MNNHYIPRLLLRQFATGEKVNSYDFIEKSFKTKKLRNTFAAKDLFDSELESLMAYRIEGPIGNLLNNKLLQGRKITINRKENLLLRKFLMINYLRSPIINCTWDESVERTCSKEHPSVQTVEFLSRNYPGFKSIFGKSMSSDKTYIRDLKKAMAYDSLEDICDPANELDIPVSLEMAAKSAMVTTIAFWDCENTEQEFIMPKLQGISIMDQVSNFYKVLVINERKKELEKKGISENILFELERLKYGSLIYPNNFAMYPLAPTRMLICFSPYFRAFFPLKDPIDMIEICSPFLKKEQFNRHFFDPMRMELFQPCRTIFNQQYNYIVKSLTAEEVMLLNSVLLNMETEEFIFHDYNKIRDSFWFYEKKARFAISKKHNFSQMV